MKMWHIYTVGHSSADERNEILIKFQVNENSHLEQGNPDLQKQAEYYLKS